MKVYRLSCKSIEKGHNMNDTNPALSVIVPVYNRARELTACLNSICSQTLRRIEVVCVDDGSLDESWSILEAYHSKDARVKICRQANQGAGRARNVALKMATGDFVAFMDPDDLYSSNDVLEKLYEFARSTGLYIVGGGIEKQTPDGQITPIIAPLETSVVDYFSHPFAFYYTRFIYKRAWLIENELFFPSYLRYQDPPFLVAAMVAARRFAITPIMVYRYCTGDVHLVHWEENDWLRLREMFRGMRDVVEIARQFNLRPLIASEKKRLLGHWLRPVLTKAIRRLFAFQEFRDLLTAFPEKEKRELERKLRSYQTVSTKKLNKPQIEKRRNKLRQLVKALLPYGIMRYWLRKHYGIEIP